MFLVPIRSWLTVTRVSLAGTVTSGGHRVDRCLTCAGRGCGKFCSRPRGFRDSVTASLGLAYVINHVASDVVDRLRGRLVCEQFVSVDDGLDEYEHRADDFKKDQVR